MFDILDWSVHIRSRDCLCCHVSLSYKADLSGCSCAVFPLLCRWVASEGIKLLYLGLMWVAFHEGHSDTEYTRQGKALQRYGTIAVLIWFLTYNGSLTALSIEVDVTV